MDANAQNLIAEAYQRFHAPPAAATVRAAALQEAAQWLGTKESPANSNRTPFGAWYGADGQPWCAMFCTYAFEVGAFGGSPSFAKGQRYAYVPYIVDDARHGRNGLSITTAPIPGDLVCYDWDGGDYDHVGIFEGGNANEWTAIEGNTSASNNSNGGEVQRRTRNRWEAYAIAFVRVREP
jgi:hypothetical protein